MPSVATPTDVFRPVAVPASYRSPVRVRNHALDVPKVTGGRGKTWHGTGQQPSDEARTPRSTNTPA